MANVHIQNVVLALCMSFVATTTSQSCDSSLHTPLSIPIRNVSLQNPVLRRGIPGSIGTPPQPIAFQIQALANNVFIYDSNGVCGSESTSIQCLGRDGGAFEENDSSSWTLLDLQKDDKIKENPSILNVTTDIFGSDTLAIQPSINLPNFNFHLPRSRTNEYLEMCTLGLGYESTLLNEMKNTKQINSRSWSLYQGLTGEDPAHQLDGNLILGGMDQAKIKGENYTTPLASADSTCPTRFLVTVTDIVMESTDGSSMSIIGPSRGSALQMCISPGYRLITLPYEVSQSFYNKFSKTWEYDNQRAYGLNLFGFVFNRSDAYTGSLTFKLSSGLEVQIPNDQLVVPDISIASDGTTIFDPSVREVMINSLQQINSNDMPLLGHTFLSQVYLNVNYDLNFFSLWSAKATGEEDLVAISADGTLGCGKGQTPKAGNITSPSGQNGSNHDNDPTIKQSGMSSGEKAGIALGTIAAFALLVAVFFTVRYYRRRHGLLRYSQPRGNPSPSPPPPALALDNAPVSGQMATGRVSYTKAELPADSYADSRSTSWRGSKTNSGNGRGRGGHNSTTTESDSTNASTSLLEMRDLPTGSVPAPIAELPAEDRLIRS